MNKMEEILRITDSNKIGVPETNWNAQSPYMVLLDNGHGGMKNGVYTMAPTNMSKFDDFEFYEGVWTRAIVQLIASELFHIGGSYSILVPENENITLQERVRRAVARSKQHVGEGFKFYYHSVHANAFGVEKANGIEVWTSPGQTKSDILAALYYRELDELDWNMRPDMGDGDVDKEERFYVLKETPMPAILTETGFYTNYCQAQMMMSPRIMHKIADLMIRAHLEIIKLKLL